MKLILLALLLTAGTFAQEKAQELCAPCHTGPSEDFDKHPHKKAGISCDACHGMGESHRNSQGMTAPDRTSGPKEVPELCGACHTSQLEAFKQSKHFTALQADPRKTANCAICHGNHALRTAAATQQQCERCHDKRPDACKQPPAKTAAKVLCANCHVPHTLKKAGP
ncbi:MAG: cytochrome c3 family protein [Bryobacterales bacterium]|nr:cytochrome c3 family protein [Bryobacterales bacterium]